ncbi:MAG: molybdate ABC transporter substrate-binding protein [Gammaproteobacteria bacterium]
MPGKVSCQVSVMVGKRRGMDSGKVAIFNSLTWFITTLLLALNVAATPATAADLTVSAAASLTDAFRATATAYEARRPGVRIILNLAGSGQLLQQIDNGAPVDVFASADEETMDQAQASRLIIDDSRTNFARNTLVLIEPADNPSQPGSGQLQSLSDITRPDVGRIAISNPEIVPVGRYSRDALRAQGLWAGIQPRLVTTQSVRQSLAYVARAEVDAGFVYATDVRVVPGKVRIVANVATVQPIVYPIAVVRFSRQPDAGRDFIAFVRSAEGQDILQRFGFLKP